ncbi:cupin domain-containing protein [Echinicola shivajiensis]|uniref:cupin domain-containing protein n=1 Tax=Echinicola shivajiensis TaxID=1035916 RepID=UPI001BFC0816|nr:cupin domain-containing protein [Echinicola shivajiensis]
MEIQQIIKKLGLEPHPEGGYFKEVYRSEGEVHQGSLPEGIIGNRNYSTSIYFMLTSDTFSAFHRIKQDEIWHFYMGSPIRLHCLSPDGIHEEFLIGSDLLNGQIPQLVVPAGDWFAAELIEQNSFTLVGCTVSPGFDFRDFELAERERLSGEFPQHKALIERFTRI